MSFLYVIFEILAELWFVWKVASEEILKAVHFTTAVNQSWFWLCGSINSTCVHKLEYIVFY